MNDRIFDSLMKLVLGFDLERLEKLKFQKLFQESFVSHFFYSILFILIYHSSQMEMQMLELERNQDTNSLGDVQKQLHITRRGR